MRRASWVISFAVSSTVLLLLLARFDAREVLHSLRGVGTWWVVTALAVSFLSLFVRAVRWKVLLQASAGRWSLRQLFPLTLTGVSLSLLIPGGVGEIGRAYYGGQRFGHRMAMLSSSLVDKWAGLVGAVLVGLWASMHMQRYVYTAIALLGLLGLFLGFQILRWCPVGQLDRLLGRVVKKPYFLSTLQQQCRLPGTAITIALLLAVAGWLLTYLQLFLMYCGLSASISLTAIYAVTPLLTLASLVPFTWGGIGSRDVMAVGLFQAMGVAPETTLAACLLFNVIAILIPAVLGAIVIMRAPSATSTLQSIPSDTSPLPRECKEALVSQQP